MSGISWIQCSQILAELSGEERRAVKRVAAGKLRAIPAPLMNKLRSQRLVEFDGRTWVLTDEGRVISFWC